MHEGFDVMLFMTSALPSQGHGVYLSSWSKPSAQKDTYILDVAS